VLEPSQRIVLNPASDGGGTKTLTIDLKGTWRASWRWAVLPKRRRAPLAPLLSISK
jgi:hypothetical protein